MSRLIHCVAYHLADEVVDGGFRQACNLCVTETVIDKCGMPPAPLFLTIGVVAVGALGVTQVFHPDVACGVELLGKSDDDGIACRQGCHAAFEPASHILPHIENEFVAHIGKTFGLQLAEYFHVLRHGTAKGTVGNGGAFGLLPLRVIEACFRPVGKLLAGIVGLAVVFVVATDGTVETYRPFLVGADGLAAAVGKLHNQIQTECRIAEVGNLIGLLVLLHGVVAAVAQHHPNGVLPFQ